MPRDHIARRPQISILEHIQLPPSLVLELHKLTPLVRIGINLRQQRMEIFPSIRAEVVQIRVYGFGQVVVGI